jgi:hypothetical protein
LRPAAPPAAVAASATAMIIFCVRERKELSQARHWRARRCLAFACRESGRFDQASRAKTPR